MIAYLKNRFALLRNRFQRRNGASFTDQVAKVIMHTCALQLERGESRELAPVKGATGPMQLSGGAITMVRYRVFDRNADKVDPVIRKEPWRAFATVTMILYIDRDPDFAVSVNSQENVATQIEPLALHTAPGRALVSHLANYFPLLPRPFGGPVYAPEIA